jgi:hypothetical protein
VTEPTNKDAGTPPKMQAEVQSDVRKNPRRIAFILRRTSPQVRTQDDTRVMTYPGALARFLIALEIAFLLLVWISRRGTSWDCRNCCIIFRRWWPEC